MQSNQELLHQRRQFIQYSMPMLICDEDGIDSVQPIDHLLEVLAHRSQVAANVAEQSQRCLATRHWYTPVDLERTRFAHGLCSMHLRDMRSEPVLLGVFARKAGSRNMGY